jgi:hypothetical protein
MPLFLARIKKTLTSDVPIEASDIDEARRVVRAMSKDDLFDLWYDKGMDSSDNIRVSHVGTAGN